MKNEDKLQQEIDLLKEKLRVYEESPLVEGYNAILNQINTWNRDLQEEPTSLKYNPDTGDSDQKAFEKAHKFILTTQQIYDQLAYLRLKMSPEMADQLKKTEKNEKLKEKDTSLAL